MSKITLYKNFATWRSSGWQRAFTGDTPNLETTIDNAASSCIIESGWWILYDEPNFSGKNVVLGPGDYPDDNAMGLTNDTLSSLKPVKITLDSDASHIALNNRDELYVSFSPPARPVAETDLSTPRVSMVDRTGQITAVVGISNLPDSTVKNHFNPKGIAFDNNDNLFISDWFSSSIYKKTKADGSISAILGYATGQGGGGLAAPIGIVCDSLNNLYIANSDGKILKLANGAVSEIASDYTGVSIIDVDNSGNLYIEHENCVYKGKRQPDGTIMFSAFAGRAGSYRADDDAEDDGGIATNATFVRISDIAVDSQGNVYIAEAVSNNRNRIRKVDAATSFISTVVGDGHIEAIGKPEAISFDSKDNLYALVSLSDGTKSINCFKLN